MAGSMILAGAGAIPTVLGAAELDSSAPLAVQWIGPFVPAEVMFPGASVAQTVRYGQNISVPPSTVTSLSASDANWWEIV